MKLQILSDLHLESPKAYDFYEIKPSAPHLALLGDIGCVSDPGYLDFLTAQLARFRTVFHVLGNHEPYGSIWDAATKTLRGFQEQNCQDRARQPPPAGTAPCDDGHTHYNFERFWDGETGKVV